MSTTTSTPMTMLNIKVPTHLKGEAKSIASEFGISIASIVNDALRTFVDKRSITFTESHVPNAQTAKILRAATKDIKTGKNLSPKFTNVDDMMEWLDK